MSFELESACSSMSHFLLTLVVPFTVEPSGGSLDFASFTSFEVNLSFGSVFMHISLSNIHCPIFCHCHWLTSDFELVSLAIMQQICLWWLCLIFDKSTFAHVGNDHSHAWRHIDSFLPIAVFLLTELHLKLKCSCMSAKENETKMKMKESFGACLICLLHFLKRFF